LDSFAGTGGAIDSSSPTASKAVGAPGGAGEGRLADTPEIEDATASFPAAEAAVPALAEAKIAEIRQLAVKADALVDASLSANTRRAYGTA